MGDSQQADSAVFPDVMGTRWKKAKEISVKKYWHYSGSSRKTMLTSHKSSFVYQSAIQKIFDVLRVRKQD